MHDLLYIYKRSLPTPIRVMNTNLSTRVSSHLHQFPVKIGPFAANTRRSIESGRGYPRLLPPPDQNIAGKCPNGKKSHSHRNLRNFQRHLLSPSIFCENGFCVSRPGCKHDRPRGSQAFSAFRLQRLQMLCRLPPKTINPCHGFDYPLLRGR